MSSREQDDQAPQEWMRECARRNGLDGWHVQHPNLGFNSRVEFKLRRDTEAALFEVKAFTTMRTWEEGIAQMEGNDGQVTAFYAKGEGRGVRLQTRRARNKFVEHRPLGLPCVTVLANPGNANVSLDIEGLLIALYGDLVADITTGQTGIRLNPTRWTADDVTSAFLVLEGSRAARVVHTPAATAGRCPRLSASWFREAQQWDWDAPTSSFVIV